MGADAEKKAKPVRGSLAGRISRRSLFALVIATAVLALFDFVIGLFINSNMEHQLIVRDDSLFYRFRPGAAVEARVGAGFGDWWTPDAPRYHIRINQDGYRGQLVPAPKAPGELRIICLGDSITMGLTVDEGMTYPAQLETLLQRKFAPRKVSVINGGVMGYSSRQGLLLFKSKFLAYKPDVVVWGFGFNDQAILPIVKNLDVSMIPLDPGSRADRPLKERVLYWIWCRPLAQVIHGFIAPIYWKMQVGRLMPLLEKAGPNIPVFNNLEQFSQSRVPPKYFLIHLLEMDELARDRHFKLIVIIFTGTPDRYRETAREFCLSHNVAFVDAKKTFDQIFLAGKLPGNPEYPEMFKYYAKSIVPGALEKYPMLWVTTEGLHPNNVGYRIIAESLAAALAR